MDAEIKERWVARLREGAYEQCGSVLREYDTVNGEHSYCALGVLCEMYCGDLDINWETMLNINEEDPMSQSYDDDVLPPPVKEWAGLKEADPILGGIPMTVLNDGRSNLTGKSTVDPHTFKQLADLIEIWL